MQDVLMLKFPNAEGRRRAMSMISLLLHSDLTALVPGAPDLVKPETVSSHRIQR